MAAVSRRKIGEDPVVDAVQCVGCFSLTLQPLPEWTIGLKATVELEDAKPGYMFLVTIS